VTAPNPSLPALIRHWLGTDRIPHLEELMANATTQLTELRTAFADYRSDVSAKLDQLLAAQGQLQPDAQLIFDGLKADLADADVAVGDADGSDTPPADPTV
jgi:phage protein D